MAFTAFTEMHIYERRAVPKEKDKSAIQCLECYGSNIYIGTKDATVQHLIFSCDSSPASREGRARKMGSGNLVSQLRTLPLFNHLLVLWDRSVTALNMFSLEPVAAMKKIQHVSLFDVCRSSSPASAIVQMVTSSSRRRAIQVHTVGVDRWEVLREVPLILDPVAMAVDGTSVCLATAGRYLLCDFQRGISEELFPHDHSRQNIVVTSVGKGEFLLNGPGSLGESRSRLLQECFLLTPSIAVVIRDKSSHIMYFGRVGRCWFFQGFINLRPPPPSLRHVCDEDGSMPTSSLAVAPGGVGSRRLLPLCPDPAGPLAVCLQPGGSAAQTDPEHRRSEGSARLFR